MLPGWGQASRQCPFSSCLSQVMTVINIKEQNIPCRLVVMQHCALRFQVWCFFTQSAGWKGWEGGCKHPTKEGMDSLRRGLIFPPLIERLVVYTLPLTREGREFILSQLLTQPCRVFFLLDMMPGEFFKLMMMLLKKYGVKILFWTGPVKMQIYNFERVPFNLFLNV